MRYLALFLLTGCIADLDGFMHNPRHCTVVGPDTCENKEEPLDRVCTPCEGDYDFAARGMSGAVERLELHLDGDVVNDAYFIEGTGGELEDVTIMMAHGNFASIEHYLHGMEPMYLTGANLFTYEYRGYGKSSTEQTPDEPTFLADGLAAYELLVSALNARGLSSDQVVFYGMSLGALPIVNVAVAHPARALLLEAPYPSARLFLADSSATGIPPSFLLSGRYDNLEKAPNLTQPVLLMHSEDDDFIRIEHSETLFDEIATPKCFWRISGAGHGMSKGIPVTIGHEAYAQGIKEWLKTGACPAAAGPP